MGKLSGLFKRRYTVNGKSMQPTLFEGDLCWVRKAKQFNNGDIIVMRNSAGVKRYYVKRVIATEGQTVSITPNGAVKINGIVTDKWGCGKTKSFSYWRTPRTVPAGCVFVLGDNREDSLDSRSLGFYKEGFVPIDCIIGTVYNIKPAGNPHKLYFKDTYKAVCKILGIDD